MTADGATATAANIRALHSVFVDAVLRQDTEMASLLTHRIGGLDSLAFVDAVDRGAVLRIRSTLRDDRLVYQVEILSDHHGWVLLCGAYPEDLGIPDTPAVREQEIRFHAERMLRELTEDEDS